MAWLQWLYVHWPELALSALVIAFVSCSDVLRDRAQRRKMSDLWTILALALIWSFRYWPKVMTVLGR